MASVETGNGPKERYVPPKILATYSREELIETIRRSRVHGEGGCGCGTGGGCVAEDPWGNPWEDPLYGPLEATTS